MDFVLYYDDTAVVRLVGDQLVCSLELNVVAVAGELSHQIGTPPDDARLAREVVEHLVDERHQRRYRKSARHPPSRLAPLGPARSKAWRPRRQRISNSASWALHAFRDVTYERRATYMLEADIKKEGALRSLANAEVSCEKTE